MTIEEARNKKHELQSKIYELIEEFEQTTNVTIDEVFIMRHPAFGDQVSKVFSVGINAGKL